MCAISPGGLLFVTQICSRRRVNNLPELWHRCGASSREELSMINNWSSPSCNFIHCLSSNWLLQVGFLTCPTINVLPFMHLINGHCSFMKNTLNYIRNWKAAAVCAVSLRWGRRGDINQPKWNSTRQTESSRPNWTIFHIVVTLPLWHYTAAQVFL